MNREDYLLENEQYLRNLNSGLKYLEQISSELLSHNIDIKTKPWYKNLIEIYIPMAFNFYDNCKNIDFDINKDNDLWIRKDYKSFLSEVEKFIKFIIKFILELKDINFYRAINELDNVVIKYKKLFDKTWEEEILNIKEDLHWWQGNYNENKHDEDKIDDNFYIKDQKGFCIGNDVLEYISDFLYRIICPLLTTLLIIIKTK